MQKDILSLRELSNAEILDGIRSDASMEYQARIPLATDAGVNQTVAALADYRPAWNEFLNSFVNRIGTIYARSSSWSNPLAIFKKGLMGYGDTVEEYMADMLEAHTYDPDRDYTEKALFGQERPDVETNYHKVNRQNYYKFTLNEKMLKRAFLNDGSLSDLVGQLMAAPLKSDQWDEFLLMAKLFAQNEKNNGFFKLRVPDFSGLSTNSDDARTALKAIKSLAYRMTTLSREFNAAGRPIATNPEDMVLIGTPDFLASIDVDGLAPIFHMDKAAIVAERTIAIPEQYFGINGAQGVLTTADFFMVFDTLLENRSMPNPAGLYDNYFLHHHQIISLSRFAPAVLLTSESETISVREDFTVSAIANPVVTNRAGGTVTDVERGSIYNVSAAVTTTPAGHNVGVAYSVTGNSSTHTYITPTGVLYVAGDERAESLTVVAHTVRIDPANPKLDALSSQVSLTVSGAISSELANGEIKSITILGANVPNVVAGTTSYTLTLPSGSKVSKKDVAVATVGSPDVEVTVSPVASRPGVDVRVAVDAGAGAARVYTVQVTIPAA